MRCFRSGLKSLLLKFNLIWLISLFFSNSLGMNCVELLDTKTKATDGFLHKNEDKFRLPVGMGQHGFNFLVNEFRRNRDYEGFVMIILYGSRLEPPYGPRPTDYSDLDIAFVQETPGSSDPAIKKKLRAALANEFELLVTIETPLDLELGPLLRSERGFSSVQESSLIAAWREFQNEFERPAERQMYKAAWNSYLEKQNLSTHFNKNSLILVRQRSYTGEVISELNRRGYFNIIVVE